MLMNIINIAYTYTIIYTLEINEAADNNVKMVFIYILMYTVHRDFCK